MKALKKVIVIASAVAFVFTAVAVPMPDTKAVITAEAATLKLNKKSLTLETGKTYKLKVKGAGKKKIKWSSSDKDIATVNKSGKVTAKKEGIATIKAKIGRKTLKCNVTVPAAENDDNQNNGGNNGSNTTPTDNLTEIQKARNELIDYIKANGYTNQNHNMAIRFSSGTTTIAYVEYAESKNELDFGYMDTIAGSVASMMSLPLSSDDPYVYQETNVSFSGYSVAGYTLGKASEFKFDDSNNTMPFIYTKSTGDLSYDQKKEVLNIGSKSAFTTWNLMLTLNAGGTSLNRLGFISYSTSSDSGSSTLPVVEKTYFEKLQDYIEEHGTENWNSEKVVTIYNNGSLNNGTSNTIYLTNHKSMHTIELELDYYTHNSGGNYSGKLEFQINKNLSSPVLTYEYVDNDKDKGFKIMSADYNPSTYREGSSYLGLTVYDNTFYGSSSSSQKRYFSNLFPYLLKDIDAGIRFETGFGFHELGFADF